MSYHDIIDELRHTAGRLAMKHPEEKAKRAALPKKAAEPEEPEAPAEGDEDPAEEAQETSEEEQAEAEQEGITHVFRRATRHARVVSHPGHGQKRPSLSGPPAPPPTVRAAAEKIGMPPPPKKSLALRPRVVGPKR